MVISLEQGADLHMAQLMPLPLTFSCFSEIQIGFTFLVLAHPGSPGKRAAKWVCVCVTYSDMNYRVIQLPFDFHAPCPEQMELDSQWNSWSTCVH